LDHASGLNGGKAEPRRCSDPATRKKKKKKKKPKKKKIKNTKRTMGRGSIAYFR